MAIPSWPETTVPANQPYGLTLGNVALNSSVTFNVAASGTPPFVYQWQLNGNNLANGSGVSGANSATLTLASVQLAQAGSYSAGR